MTATPAGSMPNSSADTWLTTVSGLLPHSGQPSSHQDAAHGVDLSLTLSGVLVAGSGGLS